MSNNDDLRNRFKAAHNRTSGQSKDGQDIGAIWQEQKKLERERAQLKKRNKAKNNTNRKSYTTKIRVGITTIIQTLISLPSKLISSKPSLNKKTATASLAITIIAASSFFVLRQFSNNSDSTATLGESSSAERAVEELPQATNTEFNLLFPVGIDPDLYQVRLSSPPAQPDPAYTYLDRPTEDGVIIQVTQQAEPDNFNLAEAAEGFGLSSVIQIDGNNVYHGFSERGGIQSLIFTKENRIVSIRSPQKLSDDAWVNYILSLQLQQ